jgi:cyclin H
VIKPLNKKLKKCRDPDRVDLVALQKAKREQVQQKMKAKSSVTEDGDVFGKVADKERDSKRRKVADDPFGPPL